MKFGKTAAVMLVLPTLASAAIVANVGSVKISDDDIKAEYSSITDEQKEAINEDELTKKNIVNNAVNTEVLYQAAKKAGLDKNEEYQRAVERFQKQYLASQFMRKAVEPKLSTSDVKKFFSQNKSFFDSTEVCAKHIVMKDEDEAKKVYSLAKKKGANFEALAKKHSLDPSVQDNKGYLGCFTREKMVPEFTSAAFDMRKNEVRGPVRTMYGYHVIQVTDIKPGKVPGYDEIEQKVKETYRLKVVTELIEDLRKKSNVSVNEEAVKKLKL